MGRLSVDPKPIRRIVVLDELFSHKFYFYSIKQYIFCDYTRLSLTKS